MSSGMNMQEAEKVAENMSYRQAVINCLYARCVPYRKATKIKIKQLLEIAEKRDEKIKHDKQISAEAIDEYMNKLCDKCIQQPNECWNLECPFADDECQIIKIAEQLKEQNNTYTAKVDGVKREFM